jgi:drug/metabolite transporter (DMT)-like permease
MPRHWKSSSALAITALVGVTAVWGATFLVVQKSISRMPVMDFLAWRFTIATLVMIALRPKCVRGITANELRHGIILGLVLGAGYFLQTYGLLSASAAVSGFITGMFVVLTPVMAWLILRQSINRNIWLAVVLAAIGLALLSLHGWVIGIGELLTFGCAIFFAIHIVGLGAWSSQHDTYRLTLIQIGTVAVVSLIVSVPGGITLVPDAEVWIAIGITALLATALAFLVQTWAQALVSPTRAAVVMTMEPVFAGIFAVVFGGNQFTLRIMVGAAMVLTAMYIVQIKPLNPSHKSFQRSAKE